MRRRSQALAVAISLGALLVIGDVEAQGRDEAEGLSGIVAYARATGGYWQIWTYDVETGEHAQQTRSPFDKREMSWVGNSELLFRNHNDELFRVRLGEPEEPFRKDVWPAFDPVQSPAERRVVVGKLDGVTNDQSSIWLLGPESGEQEVLTRGPGLWGQADWSSDGSLLVYARSQGYRGSEIRTMAMEDRAETVLLSDEFHNVHPEWSPDDRSIAYASDRSGDYEIYLRAVESGEERRLTERAGLDIRPSWSPDGRRLAYTSLVEGRVEVWTVRPDGTGAERLFDCGCDARDPVWR